MTDTDDQAERLRVAAQEFGKALGDSLTNLAANIKTARRKAVADSLVDEFGPGPWILHPDGSVTTIELPRKTPTRKKTGPTRG